MAVALGLAASLLLMIVGARWAVEHRWGTDIPVWDQWDAEGLRLLAPWFGGGHFLRELFTPQNEHRIVLTKLANLCLTLADGQWDQRLECAANAFLPGLLAATLLLFGWRFLGARWLPALTVFLAAAYAPPISWQNVNSGLHSAQFFLIALSFGAILLLPWRGLGGARWLGAACAVAAMGTMATGFFASIVCLIMMAPELRDLRTAWRTALPAAALCAGLSLTGWFTRLSVAFHEGLKARGAADFCFTVLNFLQWPAPPGGPFWMALALWLPAAWLAARLILGGATGAREHGRVLAGLALWVFAQILATAYARGAGGAEPGSRYLDTLVFGLVANGLALAWLWRHGGLSRPWRAAVAALAAVWLCIFGTGAWAQVSQSLRQDLPGARLYFAGCEENVRAYLATGDESFLHRKDLPYPGVDSFLVRLDTPPLRRLMPASVRPPLPLKASASGGTFIEHRWATRSPATGLPPAFSSESAGLAPTTAPLDGIMTWGSFGRTSPGTPNVWTSEPVRASLHGWLKFEVAGQLGERGVALELREARTGALISRIVPNKVPGAAWRATHVRAPRGDFVVVAKVDGPGRWLAFSQPVEMGSLSYWAWYGTEKGLVVAAFAGACALALLAGLAWIVVRAPESAPPAPAAAAAQYPPRPDAPRRRFAGLFTPLLTLSGMLVVLCARHPEGFFQPQLWAEDGSIFFAQAAAGPLAALFQSYGGYFLLIPRLAAAAAAPLDPGWIPAAYVAAETAVLFAVALALFSRRIDLPCRPLMALAIVLVPHTGEAFFGLGNVQWITGLGLVLLLIARDAETWRQRAIDACAAVLIGLTGIFSILFCPLFAARAVRRRSRESARLAFVVLATAGIQAWVVVHHRDPQTAPGWASVGASALATFGRRVAGTLAAPGAVVERQGADALTMLALGFGSACLWAALRPGDRRQARTTIAACAAVVFAGAIWRLRGGLGIFDQLGNGDRYFFMPKVLALWLMIMAGAGKGTFRWVARGICVLALVAALTDWRFVRYEDYDWPAHAARIRAGGPVNDIPINPHGSLFGYPGRR